MLLVTQIDISWMVLFDISCLMDAVVVIVDIVIVVVEIIVIKRYLGTGHLDGEFVNYLVEAFALTLFDTTMGASVVYNEELVIVTYFVLLQKGTVCRRVYLGFGHRHLCIVQWSNDWAVRMTSKCRIKMLQIDGGDQQRC